jgi:para-nitrobenzyl esterase
VRRLALFALLTFAACGETTNATPGAPADDRADCAAPAPTADGPLLGHPSRTGATCEYLGIRYAKAPTGALRFANPVAVEPHTQVMAASEHGSTCLQKFHLDEFGFDTVLSTGGDEDCLFLNVWTPGGTKRPVMVFIHGGAFVLGSGSAYNGDWMAQEGAVVVTLNYRLGPLGFLYYPALVTEGGTAGNQGILDQLLALAWVQKNIAAFGGDPENVTVFGESAGAMSVCTLLASPKAKGLFHAAIIESGGCEVTASPATGYAHALTYAAEVGCAGAPDVLACLRAVPAAELIEKLRFGPLGSALEPHVDGVVLTDTPLKLIRKGAFNRVPLLSGSNANEVQGLAAADPAYFGLKTLSWGKFGAALVATFGRDDGLRLAELYGPGTYATPFDAWWTLKSDYILACPSLFAPQAVAARGLPAYHYVFTWADLGAVSRVTGTVHGLDLFFVFGNLGPLYTLIPADHYAAAQKLAARMRRLWATFARTHAPAAADLGVPAWPQVGAGSMLLTYDMAVDPAIKRAACAFWDGRLPVGLENQTANILNLVGADQR